MIPIQELISRIRWDKTYGAADFEVGYYDRVEDRILRVPFSELSFDSTDHFTFQLVDREGETHTVPFHRVRDVYRNGERIRHR